MVEKIYKGVGSGENLYKAICNTGYSCNDPPLVSDWIESQREAYMEKEWDYESIREYMDNQLINSELNIFFDILVEHDIDIDDVWLGGIDRNDLKKWSEEYTNEKKKVCEKLLNILLQDLEDTSYSKNSRYERSYNRAAEDFNCFLDDIDTDNDDDVRQFFGISAEIEGYEIEGKEYDLSEVYICPYCDEAIVKETMKENYEMDYDIKTYPYNDKTFYCECCNSEYFFSDECFIEKNKHVPKTEILARCI